MSSCRRRWLMWRKSFRTSWRNTLRLSSPRSSFGRSNPPLLQLQLWPASRTLQMQFPIYIVFILNKIRTFRSEWIFDIKPCDYLLFLLCVILYISKLGGFPLEQSTFSVFIYFFKIWTLFLDGFDKTRLISQRFGRLFIVAAADDIVAYSGSISLITLYCPFDPRLDSCGNVSLEVDKLGEAITTLQRIIRLLASLCTWFNSPLGLLTLSIFRLEQGNKLLHMVCIIETHVCCHLMFYFF